MVRVAQFQEHMVRVDHFTLMGQLPVISFVLGQLVDETRGKGASSIIREASTTNLITSTNNG
jgi:hypothetical protein